MKILSHLVLSALAIAVAAYVVPHVTITPMGIVTAAIVLSILNLFIKPIIVVLTLPVNILTLGLFSIVINAFMVWLTIQIVPGFTITGVWMVLLFALVISVINEVFHWWSKSA